MNPITIHNLSFAYPGQSPLFQHCNLNLDDSWKLGLLGRNGRGKTTLMKILLQQLPATGQITSQLQFSYFPLSIHDESVFANEALLAAIPGNIELWQIERELRSRFALAALPDPKWR